MGDPVYLLGVDVGTSGSKAGVFSQDGKMISFGYREYSEYSPKPSWVELDPDEVWSRVKECIAESIRRVDPDQIQGVCFSALGEAVMPLGSDGKCLYPAITAYDARSFGYRALVEYWEREIDPIDLFRITGTPLNSMPSVNKVLWIRENMPDVFRKAWKFVCFEDFLVHRLTGDACISHSLASRTMLLDVNRRDWSEELLELTDLDRDLLSEPRASGEIVGEVGSKACEETLLPRGTPVVAGGHDQACGALGVGVVKEGLAMDACGSVECVASPMDAPVVTDAMLECGQCCNCHVVTDQYITLGFFPSSGIVLRWYRDNFADREKEEAERRGLDVYEVLTEIASKAPPGASRLLLLPHFVGSGTGQPPPLNRNSRGVILGLSMFHDRASVIRAILEGVAFELRKVVESLEACGIPISELRAVGGGARSSLWLQIKADVTGRAMMVPDVTEATSLGAAILAGIGTKAHSDFESATGKVYRQGACYRPDAQTASLYDSQYRVYKQIYPALVKVFDDLADLGSP